MKKLLPLLLVLAAPFSPLAAQGGRTAGGGYGYAASPIVFNGLIVQDGKVKVSLFNPNTNDAKWVQVGKQFGSYTVGFEPGRPATDRSPATKDMVILTLNGSAQRIAIQDAANLSTNTPVVTATPASLTANASAQIDALNQRLAEARNDPNADPRTIQAYEQAIARQTAQVMNANTVATGTVNIANGTGAINITNATGATTLGRTSVRTTVNADGTRTTVTTNADGSSSTTTTPAAQPRTATQPALTQ
jgi:hypothetical protein